MTLITPTLKSVQSHQKLFMKQYVLQTLLSCLATWNAFVVTFINNRVLDFLRRASRGAKKS